MITLPIEDDEFKLFTDEQEFWDEVFLSLWKTGTANVEQCAEVADAAIEERRKREDR